MKIKIPKSRFAKIMLATLALFAIAVVFLGIAHFLNPIDVAHAQAAGELKSNLQEEIINKMVGIIAFLLKALNRIFWPLILVMGGLMDNSLLFGWGMEEKLLEIWREIRNLVNVVFIVMLLAIALMNIIDVGGENYHFKTILPKFIIGLIAVNFSFLIFKVILDGLNVATTAIFSLPTTLQSEVLPPEEIESPEKFFVGICRGMCGSEEGCDEPDSENPDEILPLCYKAAGTEDCEGAPGLSQDERRFCPSQKLVDMMHHFNGQNASIILAVRMMKMADLDGVVKASKAFETEGGWETLTIGIIFSLIMYIVYGTGFVVLFIVLITRLAVLWLAIVLSPVIVLKYVFPEILDKIGIGDAESKMVSTAIAPLTIAFTMSIGFIMMDTFQGMGAGSLGEFGKATISGTDNLAQSALNLKGPVGGISSVQQFFMAAATIAFVWAGIAGASSKTVAEKLTGVITGAVGKAGGWLAFAPFKYTGLIPVKGDSISLGEGLKVLERIPQSMERDSERKIERVFPWLAGAGGIAQQIRDASPDQLKSMIEKGEIHGFLDDKGVRKALRDRATKGDINHDPKLRELIKANIGEDGEFNGDGAKSRLEQGLITEQNSSAAGTQAGASTSPTTPKTAKQRATTIAGVAAADGTPLRTLQQELAAKSKAKPEDIQAILDNSNNKPIAEAAEELAKMQKPQIERKVTEIGQEEKDNITPEKVQQSFGGRLQQYKVTEGNDDKAKTQLRTELMAAADKIADTDKREAFKQGVTTWLDTDEQPAAAPPATAPPAGPAT